MTARNGCAAFMAVVRMGLAALVVVAAFAQDKPALNLGLSIDGPWSRNREAMDVFQSEIRELLQNEYEVQFPVDKQLTGDWSVSSIRANLDRLLADDEVDMVLALGVLNANEAVHRETLPKPVLAPYLLFPEMQEAPYEERRGRVGGVALERVYHVSGKPNLTYIVVGADFRRDISQFLEITPFQRLTVLMVEAFRDGLPQLEGKIREEIEPLGVEVDFVYVGGSVDQALRDIPADAQAVYVTPLLQLPPGGLEALANGLIDRGLPSFSLWGRSEVERGLMAGLALSRQFSRPARRTAINLHRILMGEDAAEIPVDFRQEERLTLNMSTARAVGVRRTWDILTQAELISQPREIADRVLSLGQVVREAEQVNLDLAAADRTVTAGLQLIREARAALLPQLSATGREVVIDRDRALSSFGAQGQSQTSGTLSFSQLLYSERAQAGYTIEKILQSAREQDRAELRLDVVLEAAQAYLNVLRAKSVESIQLDNLELTRSNLERAESRLDLGAAGPDEVYRWESQLANNRQDYIAANAQRNQAEIQLNRVLNRPIEESFLTTEVDLEDPELGLNYEKVRPFLDNQEGFRLFREYTAAQALEASPELKQFAAAIRAQERAVKAAKRVFYVPTVSAAAEATAFQNAGPGSTSPFADGPQIPDIEFPQAPNSFNWQLLLNASLPLFQGGQLRANRTRAEIELDRLNVEREAVRLRVEQRVRSAMHAAMASWQAIDLSRAAAEAAVRNLELVQDAYAEGVVDIIRLLDAQNQSLVAELMAANAVYDFLLDLMAVQRAVGHFDYFRSDAERDDYLRRMEVYFEEAGYEVYR